MPAGKARSGRTRRGEESGTGHSARPRPVAHIDQQRCDRSPGCPVMRICPMHAVVPAESTNEGDTPQTKGILHGLFGNRSSQGWTVDAAKCSGCLLCAQYCPHGAVQPRERTVA
jgi:NAD-dependent dihydropyrimidine dehydrogenase PreA subunit